MSVRTGPALPKSLLEELGSSSGSGHHHTGKPKSGRSRFSRKELRKQDRHERKQRKVEFFSHHENITRKQASKRTADEHPESPRSKKAKLENAHTPAPVHHNASHAIPLKAPKMIPKSSETMPLAKRTATTSKSALEKLAERSQGPSQARHLSSTKHTTAGSSRSRQEIEEDEYISYLESKLGWTKAGKRTAKYGKEVGEDGLDGLLGDLDSFDKFAPSPAQAKVGVDLSDPDISAEEEGDRSHEDSAGPKEAASGDVSDVDAEEWRGIETDRVDDGSSTHSDHPEASPLPSLLHLELRRRQLTRQLKGLLNRMTEQNIGSIVDSIEEVYRNQRRHDVTSTLTTLVIDGISAHSILLDSYVVLHAALVSSLHKLIGIEFAAYFVQNVIASYEHHFASFQKQDAREVQTDGEPLGKECSNLVVLLSELYNFQVISCVLVYDLIRGLLDGALTELKVELLLKLTRSASFGTQLRQDDPSALKSIIDIVHTKIPSQANALRYDLDELKNNKLKRNTGPTAGGDAVDRLKKFLAGLSKKRHVLAHEPSASLSTTSLCRGKGKWWLVGAAGEGPDALGENALLKLARKQGMNTDIRRGIFVVLMSSDDYVDACERLSQLKLTEIQQREIIRCSCTAAATYACLEKAHNPYYTLVGQQLCRSSHAHKVTLQFCLWDFLRGLGETHHADRNVARAYAWWIAKDCCTLAVLKPVDFTVLQPQTHTFLRELLTQLFASTQLSTPLLDRGTLEEVFIKATRMHTLVVGLVYFIGEVCREDDGFVKWAGQVARDTLRTGVDAVAGL
ncbi:hypothetical protein B0H21DRAFT_780860 [Amylocystis lapponica]|nr:hypothetical protein B0H21DRAFT_780860 [Amylocystis lapponica]